jgi:hypothetical protein
LSERMWLGTPRRMNFATCVDAPLGAREIFKSGVARGRVLTCVRPLMRLTRRRPGWEFADQVQVRPTRSRRLSQSWFSRSRLGDRCAIPLLQPSRAPTAPRPRALRRSRPELDRSRPWPSRPRRCGPSCWPKPPAPASAACRPACGPSMSRPGRHVGLPSAGRYSRR